MNAFLTLMVAITACSEMSGTLVAAHRGGLEGPYPENTLPAFRQAVDLGAQLIEMDLRATADGSVVIHHDRSLARTTGNPALLHRLTLADLRAINSGSSAAIPTLQEVLAWARPQPVNLLLDLKRAPGLHAEAVLKPVLAAGLSRSPTAVLREGERATVFAWGEALEPALAAAEACAKQGDISVNVVEIGCLAPLDEQLLVELANATGKIVIAHAGPRRGGIGAELAALFAERSILHLDAPIIRVTGELAGELVDEPADPVLFAGHEEHLASPSAAAIARAITHVVHY